MPERDIRRFVASKEKWITNKLAVSQERSQRQRVFELNYGDTIMLRGKTRIITAATGTPPGFCGDSLYLPPNLRSDQIKSACIKLYRVAAKDYLPGRVDLYAMRMGISPEIIRINSAKKRWGSCSSKGSINFSWRLIIASDDVIDYVVVHELAHLTQMNHSLRFWSSVEKILPDYRERRQLLRELEIKLSAQSWD